MPENENELRLGFSADTSQMESVIRSTRQYIQATVDAVKAVGDFNSIELQLASSQKMVSESIRDSFSGASTERLKELSTATDDWKSRIVDVREEIKAVKADLADPSLKESIGDFSGGDEEGGGRFSGLARAGSKLRALPSTQIPGLGIGTDAIGNILRLSGVIDDMSGIAKGAGVALGAASVALVLIAHNANEVKKAAQEELDARTKAMTLIAEGTTEEINARKKELEIKQETNQKVVADAAGQYTTLRKIAVEKFGEAQVTLQETLQSLTGASSMPEIGAARENFLKLRDAASQSATELDLLTQATAAGVPTQADLAEAEKKAAEAAEELTQKLYEFAQDSIDVQVETNQKLREIMKSGSEADLDQLIESTQVQLQATKDKIAAEYELAKKYENDPVRYGEISEAIDKLQHKQTDLQGSLDQLSNTMVRAYAAANDAAKQAEQIRADDIKAYEKYQSDVTKIDEKYNDTRLKTEDKYQDTLVKIAEQAAKAAENALEKLQQKRDDLALKFSQTEGDAAKKEQEDRLDRQIKFQREQTRATEQHQRDLEKIIKDSNEREQDLILNRDFEGLFKLKRETSKQIEAANEGYNEQQAQRLEAFQEAEDDNARHFANEEAQRQENYQRSLQQAQIAYNRDRDAAVKARNDAYAKAVETYNKELAAASQKHEQELNLRRFAIVNELQMIQQGNTQKLALEAQYYAASQQLLQSATARLGKEGFGRARDIDMPNPGGSGRGGGSSTTVNNGNSIGTVNLNQNIRGNDDARIAAIARAETAKMLDGFLN